ncbi:MAG: hypothetical protein Q8R02_24885 [Hyphomonadaceae bacterium]|nr:hypothetical protein [Hyphomonadaceae bacterium]
MFKSLKLPVMCAAMLAAANCSPQTDGIAASIGAPASKAPLVEEISENTYFNKPFGVTVTAPDGWFVMDTEQTGKLMDAGKEIITAGQDVRTKAAMEMSVKRTDNIFSFFKYAPGAPVDDNAAIMSIAEDVGMLPGIASGKDYFFHAKRMLDQTNTEYKVIGDYQLRKIGGRDFDEMDIKMISMGVEVSMRYFAAKRGDDVVLFIQTYRSESDLPELDKILDSIKLDW